MVERQDIDALLVGALYGELTPADEARLSAHLESHPTDRSALDGLKSAREAVRESRIFQLQLDPPQAVSALLLQEAARRAPKLVTETDERSESWFARFVRSFVAHPAMAAAAMFVVVIGVAGTIYLKQGNEQVANQRVESTDMAPAADMAPTTPTNAPQAITATAAAGSASGNYKVGLTDNDVDGKAIGGAPAGAAAPAADPAVAKSEPPRDRQVADIKQPIAPHKSNRYVEVRTPERMPKDLPDLAKNAVAMNDREQQAPKEEARAQSTPSPATGAAGGGGAAASVAPAAPPPPPMTATPARQAGPAGAGGDKADAPAADRADEAFTWAQAEHKRLVDLVASGKCQDAAPIAVSIRNRAPDYYNSYVASDRKLKSCMQYITDAAEKDTERSSKSRPSKRADMNESSK